MTRGSRLRVKLLAVSLMALAAFLHPTRASATTALFCVQWVQVANCDSIPAWVYETCMGCERSVGCAGPGLAPPYYDNTTWVAGCDYETIPATK
jgi:hypothetical protein